MLSLKAWCHYDVALGKPLDQIRTAVANDRFFVAWHADERREERGITAWQLVASLEGAKLVRDRPRSKPNPSVVVRQILQDGSEVEVIGSWLGETRVRRGRYVVQVEVDVVYPAGDPSEPCLEPATVRWLDEVARRAEKGDVAYLRSVGDVFRAVPMRTK
jgi:hypothetical protein